MPRFLTLSLFLFLPAFAAAQLEDFSKAAQAFRRERAVVPINDKTVIAEAEEFKVLSPGWQARPFGTNYYAATFANAFLSRRAYLGAPEQCETTEATIEVEIPKAGKYLALVRYEAAYRFETQFTLTVEQAGAKKLERLYGARDNLRIWAFREALKKEVAWSWGAGENVVWEGHDAFVDLQPGVARLTLKAGKQPGDGARRNVDLVMLTSDLEQVKMRIDKENYLPLDGMLTQAGDVWLKVHNHKDSADLKLTVGNGTEHSPYWVHIRDWKPLTLDLRPGASSDWNDVGRLLDTLSDGQWTIQAAGKGKLRFDLEFNLKDASGKMVPLARFTDRSGPVTLAYDAGTRYSRRLRLQDDILYDLVDYLKKRPVKGKPLEQTLIYGGTFPAKPGDPKYTAALTEFLHLMGGTAIGPDTPEDATGGKLPRGYIDVRSIPTPKLEEYCKKLQADKKAEAIAVVSLGDEIGLGRPGPKANPAFRDWLKGKGLKPADVDPAAKDWAAVSLNQDPKIAARNPTLFYYSQIFAYRFGIDELRQRTDILKKHLPNAGIGANFSPHHGAMYLGPTHHWISVFREGGMTMPWGEDYVFQVPVGSQQMNFIMVDMFRAAIRNKPGAKIHYYVMPHVPNNTVESWRRQFYGDLAHGVKVFNLFEFRPVQFAYTENHCTSPPMYQEVRKSLHELGTFEDIVQSGAVLGGDTAIWASETGDVWDNHKPPFESGIRTLYVMLRQLGRQVDFAVEGDDLTTYKLLVLCDQNVSRAASKAIADYVRGGGTVLATAGAGMFDEFNRPNDILRGLLGVADTKLVVDPTVKFEKQDLPFARPLTDVSWMAGGDLRKTPLFGAHDAVKPTGTAKVDWRIGAGGPGLITRAEGKGKTIYCAFLPGLSYFHRALPRRPFDRGATNDSFTHFIPTEFDAALSAALDALLPRVANAVTLSDPLVEHTIIAAKDGTAIPLVNWSKGPIKGLRVVIPNALKLPTKNVALASGQPLRVEKDGPALALILDLDVADAIILRAK
ncbi:MAG: beta-galactosidase trimerization domain-containing protein [Gemmataceae bacterium]